MIKKRVLSIILVVVLIITSVSFNFSSQEDVEAKEFTYALHVYNTFGKLSSGNDTVSQLLAKDENNKFCAFAKIKVDGESSFMTSLSKYVVYDDVYSPVSIDNLGTSYQKYLKAAVYYCNDIYEDYNLSKDARYILSQVLVLRIMQLRSYKVPATYQNIISSDYNDTDKTFKDVIGDICTLSDKITISSTNAWNEIKNVLQRVNNNDSLILDGTTLYLYKSSDENNSPVVSGYVTNIQSAYIKIIAKPDQDNVSIGGIKYEVSQLYDGIYEQVAILTTDENGIAMTSEETAKKLLPNHTYYIKMLKNVEGIVSETTRYKVYTNGNGKLATITLNCKVASCYYNVDTTDSKSSSTKLEGAEYTVKEWSVSQGKYVDIKKETVKYDISGPLVISSASNGYCQSPLLYYTDSNHGMFEITEREAASGYLKSYFSSVNTCKYASKSVFNCHVKTGKEYAQVLFKTSMSDGSTPDSMSVVYGFYSDEQCQNELCTVRTNDEGEGSTLQNDLSFGSDGTVTVYMKYKYATYGNIEPSNFEVKKITLSDKRGIVRIPDDENVLKFKEVENVPDDGFNDNVSGQIPIVLSFNDTEGSLAAFDLVLYRKLESGDFETETYTELDADGNPFEATRIKEYTMRNKNDIYIGHVPWDVSDNKIYSFDFVVGAAVNHWEKTGNTISLKISSQNTYKGEGYSVSFYKGEKVYAFGYNLTTNVRQANVATAVNSSSYIEFKVNAFRAFTTVATADSIYSGILWTLTDEKNTSKIKYAMVKVAEDVEDTDVVVTDKNGNETIKKGTGYVSNDEIIKVWTGSENENFCDLTDGEKYRVVQLESPESFYDNNSTSEFSVKACSLFGQVNPQAIAISHTRTSVSIRKMDIDENLLMDSVFELYDSDGELVETWRAGDSSSIWNNGQENHTIEYLHMGEEYTLCEVSAGDGYLKNEPYKFVVNNQTGNQQITIYATGTRYALRWQNESIETDSTARISGTYSVVDDNNTVVKTSKKDSNSTLYLNGLACGLEYKVNQVTIETDYIPDTNSREIIGGNNLDEADQNKVSSKMDDSFSSDNEYGSSVREDSETIDAFKRNYSTSTYSTTVYSDVDESEVPSEGLLSAYVQPITLKSEPTSIIIKKTSKETGGLLNGTGITINNSESGFVCEFNTSNIVGAAVASPSQFTVIESMAPEGHSYADDIDVVLSDSSKAVINMEDALNNVKAEVINNEALLIKGAEFQIIDEDGNVVDEWVSDGTAHSMQNVTSGKVYTLHQTKAAAGYKKAQDSKFMVSNDDSDISYVPGNYFKPLTIYWAITDTGPCYSQMFANPNGNYIGRAKYNECTILYSNLDDKDNSNAQSMLDSVEVRTIKVRFKDRTYVMCYFVNPKHGSSGCCIRLAPVYTNSWGVEYQSNFYSYISSDPWGGMSDFTISRPVYEYKFYEMGGTDEDIDATYTFNQSYNVLASELYQQYRKQELEQNGYLVFSDMIGNYGYEGTVMSNLAYMDAIEHGTMTAPEVKVLTAGLDYSVLGSESTVTVVNEQTKLTVNKLDPKGNRLGGAVFDIIDETGEVVYTFTTSEDEASVIEGLSMGQVILREKVSPQGFEKADDVSVTISEDDAVVTIVDEYNFLNLPLAGKVKKSYLLIILLLLVLGGGAAVIIKKKRKGDK